MKTSSFLVLAGSLAANLALAAILLLRPAPSVTPAWDAPNSTASVAGSAVGGAPAAMPDKAGGPAAAAPASAAAPAGSRKLWDQLRSDDLAALVPKLREAGFPPTAIRRIVGALVNERFDARRLEIEKALFEAPITAQNTNSFSDPKMGPELLKLQREQVETMKKLMGGSLNDYFADNEENKAMLRLQIGDIAPEKIEQLYASWMEFNAKRMQVTNARGNSGPMLAADYEKMTAMEKEVRAEMGKFLSPTEANDFFLRNALAAGRLRDLVGPARPTEMEYRALFPIYQAYLDQFPSPNQQGEPPEQANARKAAEAQMFEQVKGIVGVDRAADFQQAGNPSQYQLNRLVSRLDLPISAATQVTAVQTEMQQRAVALRDPALPAAERNAQLELMQQEATTRISKILGGTRGLEAYKQYGGQWLVTMVPRPTPPQPPKN